MLPVDAIAFDLDDTLTDWWSGIDGAARAVGDDSLLERVRAETWVHADGVVVNRHHWRLRHEAAEFVGTARAEAFLAALDPPLFDDVLPAFESLRGRTRLALLTNNPFGEEVLRRHGLHTDLFECVVIADPAVRKPDPRAFDPLVAALELAPDRIAYVGDSISADVAGATAAGLRPVWLDRWDDDWSPSDGVVRVSSLRDLVPLV
jgi:putative hydrolase of the HAD superfamily